MTTYAEKTSLSLLTGASDPDGDPITVRRINGEAITWTGAPMAINLPIGAVNVWGDGTVRYDDEGTTAGHPLTGVSTANGSFTFTLWDGQEESPTYTCTIQLTGAELGDVTEPTPQGMTPANGSTDASVGTNIILTFSEPIQFGGSGTVTLRDTSDNTVVEAFDIISDRGTGNGQVAVTGSNLSINPSGTLPEATTVAVRITGGSLEDLAGNPYEGHTDNSWIFTTAAAVQTSTGFQFGAQTPAGQAGIAVSSFTPDSTGHFERINGRIVGTSAGEAAGYNQGPYSVTINGQAEQINVVANAIHVSSWLQTSAAFSTLKGTPNIDSKIIIRDGSILSNGGEINITNVQLNGTFSDPNASGYAIVSRNAYDPNASGNIAGGSITLTCDSQFGGRIADRMFLNGCDNVIFDGVDFTWHPTRDGWNLRPGLASSADNKKEVITANGDGIKGDFIFRNCRFGAGAAGVAATRYPSIFIANGIGRCYFEDSTFDGFFYALQTGNSRRAASRRNVFRRRVNDCHRSWGRKANTTGGSNVPQYFDMGHNLEYDTLGQNAGDGGYHWLDEHADNFQVAGTNSDTGCHFLSYQNIYYAEVDQSNMTADIHAYYNGQNGRPDYRNQDFSDYYRRPQGVHSSGNNGGVGEFYEDVFISNALNGITFAGMQADITRCLILEGGAFESEYGQDWSLNLTSAPSDPVTISGATSNLRGGAQNNTKFNKSNLAILDSGSNGLAASYNTNFVGPFTPGSHGMDFSTAIDRSSPAAFRASVQAAFAALPGSAMDGRGPF